MGKIFKIFETRRTVFFVDIYIVYKQIAVIIKARLSDGGKLQLLRVVWYFTVERSDSR